MKEHSFLELGRILIEFPLSYQYIKSFHLKEQAGEHAEASFLLVSDQPLGEEEINRLSDVAVTACTPGGEVVFAGVCTSAGVRRLGGYSELFIEAKGRSCQADIIKYSRTFQDPGKCLSEVIDSVLSPYQIAVSYERDIPVPIMLSQQDETDWHFARRIANQFGFQIFSDGKSRQPRLSIGVVPFSVQSITDGDRADWMEKDIASFWSIKNNTAPDASAYEFLQQGYHIGDLTLGVGHTVSGGPSGMVVTKSEITANQGLLSNAVLLTPLDGAYPLGIQSEAEGSGDTGGGQNPAPVQKSNPASGPDVMSGTVLAVSGNDIQVQFQVDGPGGAVRWVPYGCVFSNDFYCMPDIGDTVYCYYESSGTVVCLGSRHINTGAPDFSTPEDKVLTANNRMIKQKRDEIQITANRQELDGFGGEQVKIIVSDTDGIELSASREVNITAEHTLLIQSNDLDEVREEPTQWFDSMRKEKMDTFEANQRAGNEEYVTAGGNTSYNAGWDLAKTLGGNLIKGLVDDITSPFQLVSTVGDLLFPGDPPPEKELVTFEKVDEYQILILGLQSCTLQVTDSSVYFTDTSIIFAGPKFRWLGINTSSDYPQQSESQQTFMDSIMDAVQLGIDIIGCIPGCNVVCGALNAGISLLRGDYYGAVSGLAGMLCPGGGLVTRGLGMAADASKTAKKVIKALKILKTGAVALNAFLLGAQDAAAIYDRIADGTFDLSNPEDLALLTSLLRKGMTVGKSAKALYDMAHPKPEPKGDEKKEEPGDGKKKDSEASEQKKENEVTCKDPIDVITGSQKIVQTDFLVRDILEPFGLIRTYQSIYSNEGGLLGNRWHLNVGSRLTIKEDRITVFMPDMHLEHFKREDGVWVSSRVGDTSVTLSECRDGYLFTAAAEQKRYTYDHSGRLTAITDRNQNCTWLRYVNQTLTEIEFAGGQRLSFSYKEGKVSAIRDLLGRTVSYRYEGELLTQVEYPNHGVIRYTYTPEGFLKQITDQNGHTYVENDYDGEGRVTRQILANGQESIVLYDDSRRINTFLTVKSKERTAYHYNKERLLVKKVYTDGSFEEYGYDSFQNRNRIRDRMGGELLKTFCSTGRLLEERLPNGLVTSFAYDEAGNRIREWDNGGRLTEWSYDERGNCILERRAIGGGRFQKTQYQYDRYGRLLTITDPRGNAVQARYEGKSGNMVSYTTAEGNTFRYTYDEAGRRMSESGESGRTEYAYNHFDYRTRVVDPLGNTTKYSFDMLCNLTKVVLPNQYDEKTGDGAGTRYLYDEMDEVVCRIDPLGNVFAALRDEEENVVKEVNPNCYDPDKKDGEGICYEYDHDDRRIKILYPDGGIERIKYDANGNIIKRILPEQYQPEQDDGPGYSYSYDEVNRLVEIRDPQGTPVRRYVYDLHGNIRKAIDARGYGMGGCDEERIGTLYQYDAMDWMTEKREPVKEEKGRVWYRVTGYSYDEAGNLTAERRYQEFQEETGIGGAVHTISFEYDKDNRRSRVSDCTGAAVEYRYNSRNQCIYEKRRLDGELSQIFRYRYDEAGRMISAARSVDQADGSVGFAETRYEYDKTGNLVAAALPEGGVILREYDEADRLTAEVHRERAGGIDNRNEFTYDKAGNLIEIRDSLGRRTTLEYDLLNREIRRIQKDGSIERQFYDGNGSLVRRVRPNQYDPVRDDGAAYQYTYDLQGRVVTVIGPDGTVLETNTYDGDGQLLQKLDGCGGGADFTYDLSGNRTRIESRGGARQEFRYDARGNIVGIADGNDRKTEYGLDLWGRITRVKKADGSSESYTYNDAGNMTSSTDGEGNTTRYEYGRSGMLLAVVDPAGGREEYSYDREDRLQRKRDRNGVLVEYGYNLYGAPVYRRVVGGRLENRYEYTKEGLLKAAVSGGMHYAYEHDALGRMERKSASGRTLLAVSYDKNGNKILQKDVTGKVTEYRYNALDFLTEVWDDGVRLAEYDYHEDGTVRRVENGPIQQSYTYDLDKNLVGLRVEAGGSLLAENRYAYDGNGNRTWRQQLEGETRYGYDSLNQLVRVEYPKGTEELYYDRAGNRTRRVLGAVTEDYGYDSRNRLKTLTRNGLTVPYTYDDAGNLLKDDRASYSYDAFNRAVKAETFDGSIQINRYDAEDLRYEMEENGRLVQFIFHQEEVITEQEEGCRVLRLIRGSELLAQNSDYARTYYHYASDEMGSVTYITDGDGKVENRYAYDAWGNVTESEEGIGNRFRFTGQQYDPVTQQYYLRARFYNPVIARFTQEDTYRGAGLNLYAYCRNNPVTYVDPSGHQPSCVKDAAKKYMEQGMSKEEAYRKAYADHADDKLKDPSNLSAKEKYELEQRQKRLGNQPEGSKSDSVLTLSPPEVYYRTMSPEDYDKLRMTGELQPTKETCISPTKSFSDNYDGVTVKFELEPGTTNLLKNIGVSNNSKQAVADYGTMPQVSSGWTENNAFFKGEGKQTNIGLGQGKALEIFNSNILNFEEAN